MIGFAWTDAVSLSLAATSTISLIVWPLMKTRRSMLLAQLSLAVSFGGHYELEGLRTAALLNAVGALHVASSLAWGNQPRLRWISYGMIPAIVAACLISWSGIPSLLSTIGMLLIALGRVQTDAGRLRLLVLAGCPFWLAHDVIVGSPLAIADLLSLLVGAAALRRDRRLRLAVRSLPLFLITTAASERSKTTSPSAIRAASHQGYKS